MLSVCVCACVSVCVSVESNYESLGAELLDWRVGLAGGECEVQCGGPEVANNPDTGESSFAKVTGSQRAWQLAAPSNQQRRGAWLRDCGGRRRRERGTAGEVSISVPL